MFNLQSDLVLFGRAFHTWRDGAGNPLVCEGSMSTVQCMEDQQGRYWALKVFRRTFRDPSLRLLPDLTAPLAAASPGLAAGHLKVLTPDVLGSGSHDLEFSLMMPWIFGPTWAEVMADPTMVLDPDPCLTMAMALADTLTTLEEQGLAHCDLGGDNLLLPALAEGGEGLFPVALVDLDQMFHPGRRPPAFLPGGPPGYSRGRVADSTNWSSLADRIPGGLLLAEILGGCVEGLKPYAAGRSYFDPHGAESDDARYQALRAALAERWGPSVTECLERTWECESPQQAPMFQDWRLALMEAGRWGGPGSRTAAPVRVQTVDPRESMARARRLQAQGDLEGALGVYRGLQQEPGLPDGVRMELPFLIQDLEEQIAGLRPQAAFRAKMDPGLPVLGVPEPGPAPAPRDPLPSPAAMQRPPRPRWLVPVAAVLAFLVLGAGGLWALKRGSPTTVDTTGTTVIAEPGSGRGEVTILAEPGTFNLYVDDRFHPANPVRSGFRLQLPSGGHRFRLEATGFEPVEKETTVPAGGMVEVGPVRLERASCTLVVRSSPGGARIFLDGRDLALVTDHRLQQLASGRHEIRLEKQGFETVTAVIQLRVGQTEEVVLALRKPGEAAARSRSSGVAGVAGAGAAAAGGAASAGAAAAGQATGNLTVTSMPPGAQILVNGQPQTAPTDHRLTGFPPGTYAVTVRKPGFADATMQVKVDPGQEASVQFRLQPGTAAAAPPPAAAGGAAAGGGAPPVQPGGWVPDGRPEPAAPAATRPPEAPPTSEPAAPATEAPAQPGAGPTKDPAAAQPLPSPKPSPQGYPVDPKLLDVPTVHDPNAEEQRLKQQGGGGASLEERLKQEALKRAQQEAQKKVPGLPSVQFGP